MSRTFYYARVSSKEQNLDRQLDAFRALGADERDIYTDKASGKDLERIGYKYLKQAMRENDTLVIKSLDRLSRNKDDIANEIRYFREKNIRLKVIDLPTTMRDDDGQNDLIMQMVNNILIEVLSTIAQQERETIRKRQAEGIASAHGKGVKFGRPTKDVPEGYFLQTYAEWKSGLLTAKEAMQHLDLSRTNFYKKVGLLEQGMTENQRKTVQAYQSTITPAMIENAEIRRKAERNRTKTGAKRAKTR